MPSSFKTVLRKGIPRGWTREPRIIMRVVLGVLLAANVITALLIFKPWSGSSEDLERQASAMRQQIQQKETAIARLRSIVSKVETARSQGEQFEQAHFMQERTASSTIESELDRGAQQSGLKQKERVFSDEPIEDSDLSFKSVNANFEGTFADLMQFINYIDRSPRFLILENLTATPQQSGMLLNVNMKLSAFVREGGTAQALAEQAPENAQDAKPENAQEARLTR